MPEERVFRGIWIPAEIWLKKDLTLLEKNLWAEIDSLDRQDGCYASNEYFAEFFGVSVPTVTRAIGRLLAKGYVRPAGWRNRLRVLRSNVKAQFELPFDSNQNDESHPHSDQNDQSTLINLISYPNQNDEQISLEITKKEKERLSHPDMLRILQVLQEARGSRQAPKLTTSRERQLKALAKDGATVADFETVIHFKKGDRSPFWRENFKAYMTPETLFRPSNFWKYLEAAKDGTPSGGAMAGFKSWRCPECGYENRHNGGFCLRCRHELARPEIDARARPDPPGVSPSFPPADGSSTLPAPRSRTRTGAAIPD